MLRLASWFRTAMHKKAQLLSTPGGRILPNSIDLGSQRHGVPSLASSPCLKSIWCGPAQLSTMQCVASVDSSNRYEADVLWMPKLVASEGCISTAHSRQPLKRPNCQHRKCDRLRRVYPKPVVRPAFPNQPSCGILPPDKGEEDQEPHNVQRDSGQDRVGEVCRRPERDTYEKVEKKLGPQEALRGAVRKRKQNRCDHDCDWARNSRSSATWKYPRNPASSIKGATNDPIMIMSATVIRG